VELVSQKGNFASLGPGSTAIGAGTAGAFLAALVQVMWAYSGWHKLGPVGEEVENPGKNISRALVYGMLAIIALHVLANFVYLRVLGVASVAQSPHVASDVLEMLVDKGGAKWLTPAGQTLR
jgi:basic amino acid/polyamine antiporter, APA family